MKPKIVVKCFQAAVVTSVFLFLQVFGTNVMVTVAKSFEAPIKCKYGFIVLSVLYEFFLFLIGIKIQVRVTVL